MVTDALSSRGVEHAAAGRVEEPDVERGTVRSDSQTGPGPESLLLASAQRVEPGAAGEADDPGRGVGGAARQVPGHHRVGAVGPHQQVRPDPAPVGQGRVRTVLVATDGGHAPAELEGVARRLGQQQPQGDPVDVDASVGPELGPVADEAAPPVPEGVPLPEP